MIGTLIFAISVQIFIIVHTVVRNLNLILEKDDLIKERNEAIEQLNKLKLLNKLKVDNQGSPIIYEPLD